MGDETYQEWRTARLWQNPQCDICGKQASDIHHIFPGTGNRPRTLMEPCATLILCRTCHDGKVHQGMSQAVQMAYLAARRPWDFDLERCYELTGRCWPYAHDVRIERERLKGQSK